MWRPFKYIYDSTKIYYDTKFRDMLISWQLKIATNNL
jgi:hypothetical protein